MRSKGQEIFVDSPEKMFAPAVEYVLGIQDRLPPGLAFYCEYLRKPKHNVIAYDRIPTNHLMLFGVLDTYFAKGRKFLDQPETLTYYAGILGIERVPIFCSNQLVDTDTLQRYLETESVLGGSKIEGVVVKVYKKWFWEAAR